MGVSMFEKYRRALSHGFIAWYVPLLKKASSGEPLQFEDLKEHVPLERNASKILHSRLAREWKTELDRDENAGYSPSLLKAIIRTFKTAILFTGIIQFLSKCVLETLDRTFFWIIIDHFCASSSGSRSSIDNRVYLFASIGTIAISGFRWYFCFAYYNRSEKLGIQIRTACSSLLYSKTLRLSHGSLRQTGLGQMVNLLSIDGTKLETMFEIHQLWIGPIQMCILAGLVWFHIGASCIPGIGLSVLFVFIQRRLGDMLGKYRSESAAASDKRLKLMSEIINAIRTIKMYSWEVPFSKLLGHKRSVETNIIQRNHRLRIINWIVYCSSSSVTLCLTIATFWLINNSVPSAAAMFLCIRIFGRLRIFLSIDLPKALTHLNDFKVSARRFQNFLLLNELKDLDFETKIDSDQEIRIVAENVISSWESVDERRSTSLSIRANSGQLIAITGGVGSGKSSLLLTLLKEVPIKSGKLERFGRIAYVPQQPWIFAGTIRENIVFGRKYNSSWYADVVEACALQEDLKFFPKGDATVVSEGGNMLSGGQQARVSLARAVYADADIYLLDTPLSCVDPKVGKHILEKCIRGLLLNKLRIVVTHRMDLIQSADYVYLLEHGAVKESGPPNKLSAEFLSASNTNVEKSQNFDQATPEKEFLPGGTSLEPGMKNCSGLAGVPTQTYYEYFKGGITSPDIFYKLVTFTVLTQLFMTLSEYWLKFSVKEVPAANMGEFKSTVLTQLWINFTITIFLILCSRFQMSEFLKICSAASNHCHDKMFNSVLHAPMAFFSTNTPGYVLQRFSGDLSRVDEYVPFTIFYGFAVYVRCFISIVQVILTTDSKMVLPGICLMTLVFRLQKVHLRTSRSLNILENSAKTPVLSHLCSSFHGINTIRAFGLIPEMESKFNAHMDLQYMSSYAKMSGLTWIGGVTDAGVTLFINTLICLIMFIQADGAEIGFALSSAYSLLNALSWVVGSTSAMESQMKCAENILDFHKIEPEKSSRLSNVDVAKEWPSSGNIVFKDVCLSFVPGVQVLKNINLRISSGQKIGIVGRTGAGKSSLLSALFRLQEHTGTIEIDGVDTTNVGLHDLRPRMSIIPQDPVLFEGTLRTNLDPFNDFEDNVILEALQNASLSHLIDRNASGILMQIEAGGRNLSVGEKQLICVARAILRKNKILVSDEPTSNVDIETSGVMHEKMRSVFQDCTVITIAHRVSTLMDCDKIIVMHQGEIKEFDSPDRLLRNPESFFNRHILQLSSKDSHF